MGASSSTLGADTDPGIITVSNASSAPRQLSPCDLEHLAWLERLKQVQCSAAGGEGQEVNRLPGHKTDHPHMQSDHLPPPPSASQLAAQEFLMSEGAKQAAESLSEDLEVILGGYQRWCADKLKAAAKGQAPLHGSMEEVQQQTVDAIRHIHRLIQVAGGIDTQLSALGNLAAEVEAMTRQTQELGAKLELLQQRAGAQR